MPLRELSHIEEHFIARTTYRRLARSRQTAGVSVQCANGLSRKAVWCGSPTVHIRRLSLLRRLA